MSCVIHFKATSIISLIKKQQTVYLLHRSIVKYRQNLFLNLYFYQFYKNHNTKFWENLYFKFLIAVTFQEEIKVGVCTYIILVIVIFIVRDIVIFNHHLIINLNRRCFQVFVLKTQNAVYCKKQEHIGNLQIRSFYTQERQAI